MVHELVMIVPAAENDMLMIFFKGKIKPFDPQDYVFQGNITHRTLRMCNIGVYNNKVILLHRINLILYQIIAFSPFDIAQLRKIMGMRKAGPVILIYGMGHIQQLGIDGIDVIILHRIS